MENVMKLNKEFEGQNSNRDGETSITIDDCPDEVLELILRNLCKNDLQRARLVCKRWNDLFYVPKITEKFAVSLNIEHLTNKNAKYMWLLENRHIRRNLILDGINFDSINNQNNDINNFWPGIADNLQSLTISNYDFQIEHFIYILKCTKNLKELYLKRLYNFDMDDSSKFSNLESLKNIPSNTLSNIHTFKIDYHLVFTNEIFNIFMNLMPNINHLYITRIVETPVESADITWSALHDFIKKRSSQLKSLKLQGWVVTQESIADMIQLKNLKLKYLYIKVCYYDAEDDTIMTEFLKQQNELETLILKSWSLSNSNVLAICDCLVNLETLYFDNSYRLTNDGVMNLKKLKKLKNLVIWADRVTYDGLRIGLLSEPNDSLESLNFSGTGDKFHFLESLSNLRNLKRLSLGCYNHGFCDGMLRIIIESLADYGKLEELEISDAKFTDEGLIGCGIYAVSISRLTKLKKLELKYLEDITDKAVDDLAKLKSLEHLSLAHSKITNDGFDVLVKNLKLLQFLDISNCVNIYGKSLEDLLGDLKFLKSFIQ